MILKLIVLASGMVCAPYLLAQNREFSLADLQKIAYENQPQFQANQITIEAGLMQEEYLRKDYLPQAAVGMSVSRWKYLLPQKMKLLGNSLNDLYAEFRVNQLVYDWGKNTLQRDYAKRSVDVDRVADRKLRQSVTYTLARNYVEVLRVQRTLQIQQESVQRLEEYLRNAETMYQVGKTSQADILRIRVQIETLQNDIIKTQNLMTLYKNNLNAACGNALTGPFEIVDPADSLWRAWRNQTYDLEVLKNRAVQSHPDLELIGVQRQLRIQEAALYRKDYYPSLYAFGITNIEDSRIPMNNWNWQIGISVSYTLPVFRGSNFLIKERQTRLRNQANDHYSQSITQKIESELQSALLKIEDIRSRMKGTEKIIELAGESLQAMELKYGIGKASSLDIIDAQTVLTTSQLNYNQLVIDFIMTVVDIKNITGSDELPF